MSSVRKGREHPLANTVTSCSKISNGVCTTRPHARGLSPWPRSSERRECGSPVGVEQPQLCCSIRGFGAESKCCWAPTNQELSSFSTAPQCHHAPPRLSSGSTSRAVPTSAQQPLLLPGPRLKPSPPPPISALCAASWPHPPTHIKATPAFLLILSFIIHFKSELIRGIKGPFSTSSRALLSQPWPGLAGPARQLSQDTAAEVQEMGSQKSSTFPLQTPCVAALITQETVPSLRNWLMMGPRWLTLSLACCLSLSHLSSESPAAINPLEITASSSSSDAGTFPSVLTLQKRE